MESKSNKTAKCSPNPNTTKLVIAITSSLLILLWTYTAISKLVDFQQFHSELRNQVFTAQMAQLLLWVIPLTELTAAALLLFRTTTLAGFILSTLLMSIFTGYIALVLMGYYSKVPCSCGGVLKVLDWRAHLWFNLIFLATALSGLLATLKARKEPTPYT